MNKNKCDLFSFSEVIQQLHSCTIRILKEACPLSLCWSLDWIDSNNPFIILKEPFTRCFKMLFSTIPKSLPWAKVIQSNQGVQRQAEPPQAICSIKLGLLRYLHANQKCSCALPVPPDASAASTRYPREWKLCTFKGKERFAQQNFTDSNRY